MKANTDFRMSSKNSNQIPIPYLSYDLKDSKKTILLKLVPILI